MISAAHRAIFIHIQKTGGESISEALGKSMTEPDKHWLASQLKAATDPEVWASYFKFSFVRNPWARLVSWYAMIERHREAFEAGAPFNAFQSTVLRRARSFSEFLWNMGEVEVVDGDGPKHIFRNQLDYLTDEDGALLVDFVGRTETLAEDFARISDRLATPAAPVRRLNTSAHEHYSAYYGRAEAALVAERYARDIDYFGYRFGA